MKNIGLSFIIVTLALILSSCEYNVENEDLLVIDPCEVEVSYSNTIRPLIDINCMPCHNGDGNTPFAPDLTNYNSVQGIAGLIKDVTQSGRMPKEGSLTEVEKDAIKCWVDNGALDN
jgi:hypothetical protein